MSAAAAGEHESAGQSRLDAPVSRRSAVDLLPSSILNLQRTAGNQATQGLLGRINRVVQRDRPAWADTAGWPEARTPTDPKKAAEPPGDK